MRLVQDDLFALMLRLTGVDFGSVADAEYRAREHPAGVIASGGGRCTSPRRATQYAVPPVAGVRPCRMTSAMSRASAEAPAATQNPSS